MQGFVEAHEEFSALSAQILGVSVDPWPSANAFADSLGAEFPLLGDWPLDAVSKAYGVYNEERQIAGRITFVIDGERVIRAVIDDPRDMERHSKEALEAVRTISGAT
jgi:peroxiredoxin